jgi:hypothetical protein
MLVPAPRLRTRVLLLVLLPLLPLLGYVLYAGLAEHRKGAEEARGTALRLANAVAANQKQLIDEGRQLLTTLAKDPRLRSADATVCNLFLADTMRRWPRYANLGVAALDGKVKCGALPAPPGVRLADRMYFQQAVATRDFAVGGYQIGRITGKPSLNFGYPLLDDAGQVTSVLFAALDLGWLNALATEANLDRGTTITVVDRTGIILARYPDAERWVGRSARGEPVVRAVIDGEKGTAQARGLDGVDRFFGFTPLPRPSRATPVYVTAGIPTTRALAPAREELVRDLAAVALIAVFAVVAGTLGGDRLIERPAARRERELRERAEKVARFGGRLTSAAANGGLAAAVLTDMADAAAADVGALYVAADDDGALSLAATRGLNRSRIPNRLWPGEGYAGRAAAEARPVAASYRKSSVKLQVLGTELPVRHELNVPVLHDGRPVAVVALGRAHDGAFTADERELLDHLAAQAGTALSAARTRAK